MLNKSIAVLLPVADSRYAEKGPGFFNFRPSQRKLKRISPLRTLRLRGEYVFIQMNGYNEMPVQPQNKI